MWCYFKNIRMLQHNLYLLHVYATIATAFHTTLYIEKWNLRDLHIFNLNFYLNLFFCFNLKFSIIFEEKKGTREEDLVDLRSFMVNIGSCIFTVFSQ